MPKLTPEQLKALEASASGPGMQAPQGYQPSYAYNPDPSAGVENALHMLGNVPGSMLEVGKSAVGAMSHPVDTAETILRAIAGTGQEAGRRFLGTPDTENAQIARALGGGLLERLRNPGKTVVEDPVGAFLDLSGVAGPAGRITGMGRVAEAARAASPIDAAARITGKVADAGTTGARKLAQEATALASGKGGMYYDQAFEAGRKGGESLRSFNLGRTNKITGETVANDFLKGMEEVHAERRADYQREMPKVDWKDPADKIDLTKFKQEALGKLAADYHTLPKFDKNGNFTGLDFERRGSTIGLPGERSRVENVARTIWEWHDDSPHGLDRLKQNLENQIDHNKLTMSDNTRANSYIEQVKGNLRGQMGEKLQGYNEVMKNYEAATDLLKDFKNILSAESKNPETLINKLTSALREPSNYDLRRKVIEQLERKTGKDLKSQLAGVELSQWMPSGLIGRSAMVGTASGTAAHVISPFALLSLPFMSPRSAGKLFSALGSSKRAVEGITGFMENIHNRLPAGMATEGLTIGAVVEHLKRQGHLNDASNRILGKKPPEPAPADGTEVAPE